MPFTAEDKVLIKHYRVEKGYGRRKLMKEFPGKNWTEYGLQALLKKIDETGSIERRKGSGRPRSAMTEENIEGVEKLILSQDEPGSHLFESLSEGKKSSSHCCTQS